MTTERHRRSGPRHLAAEPVCSLTREAAAQRKVPVDVLLAQAEAEDVRPDGIEYRFAASPLIWERVNTFIDEEAECCPFLAFEALEADGKVILRMIQPGRNE